MPVFSVTSITALGDILTTAALAQASLMVWKDPLTGKDRNTIIELFRQTIEHGRLDQLNIYNAGGTVLEALIYLYRCQVHTITDYLLALENDVYQRLTILASFFQHTLFNSLVSNETKEGLIDTLGAIGRDYHAGDATRLGRLAGTIIGGYVQRVEQQQEREKATRDLIVTVVGIMPLPGPLNEMLKALGVEASGLLRQLIGNIDGVITREARAELSKQLAGRLSDRLTERGGFLGLGGWQVRSGTELATIVNTMFDFAGLLDDDGEASNGNGRQEGYLNGIERVLTALNLQKIKVRT
jgi:hypothetical protein